LKRRYEFFGLALQVAWVPEILPQISAETSNTDSNFTVGVLYGFFPFAGWAVFSFDVLFTLTFSSRGSIPQVLHPGMLPRVQSHLQ
jgi:hypothetical protein